MRATLLFFALALKANSFEDVVVRTETVLISREQQGKEVHVHGITPNPTHVTCEDVGKIPHGYYERTQTVLFTPPIQRSLSYCSLVWVERKRKKD